MASKSSGKTSKLSPKEKILRLSQKLEEHNHLYYNLNQPVISDKEYDELLEELLLLEEQYPEFRFNDSPTQRIGAKVDAIHAVKHAVKMYSLSNTYSIDELREWAKRVDKGLEGEKVEYTVELKIDGASAAMVYKDGQFFLGATRGDGETGEDITHNVRTIRQVPLKLKKDKYPWPQFLDVRAEIFMQKDDFKALNQERKNLDSDLIFANARNATAGSLKLMDGSLAAKRKLSCYVHSFGMLEGESSFQTQWEFLQQIKIWGLPVDPRGDLCRNFDDVIQYCLKFQEERDDIPYDVDGVVIKVNSLRQQDILGATAKSPRWAVAYKFPASQATTVIHAIHFQVGRTGVLTPVAELEPVACGGVMISRSTLHNFDEIKRLNVAVGDTVLIQRSGDVIPKIIRVVKKGRSRQEIQIPKKCPVCEGEVKKDEGDNVAYRCINPLCSAKLERAILHFSSRKALDIEGLGESVVQQLIERKKIETVADLYTLQKDDLLELDLFAEKKAENLIQAIEKSKKQSLSRFLFGLGIPQIGEKAASVLAWHFGSLKKIQKASIDELIQLQDVGDVMAQEVVSFFNRQETKDLIRKIEQYGGRFSEEKEQSRVSDIFKNQKFVLTGELEHMTRSQAQQKIKENGGQVISSVSKKTNYVLVGKNPGSKYDKALNLEIKILTEKEFLQMIETG